MELSSWWALALRWQPFRTPCIVVWFGIDCIWTLESHFTPSPSTKQTEKGEQWGSACSLVFKKKIKNRKTNCHVRLGGTWRVPLSFLTLSSPTSFLSRLLPLQTCGRKATGKDVSPSQASSEVTSVSDDASTAGTPVTRYRQPCAFFFSFLSPLFTIPQIMEILVILVILNGDTLPKKKKIFMLTIRSFHKSQDPLLRVILLHMSHFY